MPKIPIMRTKFPSQAYMQTKGPRIGERLDDEFEAQANWDVRGMKNPNEPPEPPDWDFREYYKDAPWRMW